MKSYRSEALTLRTYSFGEAHRIVVFLSRDYGKVRGVAYGARKAQSRFGSSLELLTHSLLSFQVKENQELAVIQSCEIIRAFPAFQLSWEVNLHFSYFAELLSEFSREQQPSERLFRLALAVLEASGQVSMSVLARYLEFWLLRLEGILPSLETRLPRELAEKLFRILKSHPRALQGVELSPEEMKRLESVGRELIEYHLEKPLKTPKILRELL